MEKKNKNEKKSSLHHDHGRNRETIKQKFQLQYTNRCSYEGSNTRFALKQRVKK